MASPNERGPTRQRKANTGRRPSKAQPSKGNFARALIHVLQEIHGNPPERQYDFDTDELQRKDQTSGVRINEATRVLVEAIYDRSANAEAYAMHKAEVLKFFQSHGLVPNKRGVSIQHAEKKDIEEPVPEYMDQTRHYPGDTGARPVVMNSDFDVHEPDGKVHRLSLDVATTKVHKYLSNMNNLGMLMATVASQTQSTVVSRNPHRLERAIGTLLDQGPFYFIVRRRGTDKPLAVSMAGTKQDIVQQISEASN